MRFWTSGRRRISAVPVVSVRPSGERRSGDGRGRVVRCGFWLRALSMAALLAFGAINVISANSNGKERKIKALTRVVPRRIYSAIHDNVKLKLVMSEKNHTLNAHTMTPFHGIPYHRPISDGQKRLWRLFNMRSEGVQRHTRAAENEGLEAHPQLPMYRSHC